jgi:uncharacterized protein YbjT (DUF2867 family)
MKNVLIMGASGNIARHVIDLLASASDLNLTLFVRSARRLPHPPANARVVEGDVLNFAQLKAAVAGQDIVYANLAGDLGRMAQHIVRAMTETGVRQVIFISSIGIYEQSLKAVLKPYRAAADVLEASDLDYTILRPAWFTSADEVDYKLTQKGTPERGSVISQRSLATFITKIIASPAQYAR